ncbi:MAG TPA: hypothetical protein DHV22_08010 [Xanthomarina gelatinilytica]|uniref:PBSX phage terminase small subunit-like N-terminal domain-containing protein n=1 Tax=Xanthomarina gelatinilytica TaxID=1137281 RepID=A0A3D6BQJ9_9FLAO|nr:hypothetical protein [Xanthomarina gelatinilytica]
MAKDRERQVAKKYFVEFYKSQKEIAEDLNVSEKTVGKWVAEGNWKAERDARINSTQNQAANLKSLISELTEKALELHEKIKIIEAKGLQASSEEKDLLIQHKKEATRISQEVAMYNKTLTQFQTNKLPLGLYIEVMEDVFKELQNYDKDLFLKTLDFQRNHLQTIAQKLG